MSGVAGSGGALVTALAILGFACSPGQEPLRVRAVRFAGDAASPALDEAGLDGAAVEDAARTALAGAGFRTGEGKRSHVAAVDVSAVRVVPGVGGPRVEISVEIALTPVQGGDGAAPRRDVGSAAVPLSAAPTPRAAWRRALSEAAQRAAEGLAIGLRAEGKRTDGLIADLSSKDLRVRESAVRVLGERRVREAVPPLLAMLPREDARVAHRIVGALAQIGDPRAVPALIDLSRGTDSSLTLRLLRFIGDIGGPEAEGYLLTLASGHPDARVRGAAREALDDLEVRARDAAVSARK